MNDVICDILVCFPKFGHIWPLQYEQKQAVHTYNSHMYNIAHLHMKVQVQMAEIKTCHILK